MDLSLLEASGRSSSEQRLESLGQWCRNFGVWYQICYLLLDLRLSLRFLPNPASLAPFWGEPCDELIQVCFVSTGNKYFAVGN